MGKYRTIGNALDPGYRNDLNANFDNIDTDIKDIDQKRLTDKTGLTAEIQRVEKDSITLVNTLIDEDAIVLIQSTKDARESANVAASIANASATNADTQADYATAQGDYAKAQGDYALLKGNYADEKAILANEKATLAANEASNLGQMKIDVVEATSAANTSATNANAISSDISDAESLRVTAENNRVTAETARETNEATRQSQETARQTDTAIAISNAEIATQNAQNVADNTKFIEEYNVLSTYRKHNFVRFNGSSFISLIDNNIGNIPDPNVDTQFWVMMAQRGVDGTGSVSKVDGFSPNLNGEVISHTNKSVLDRISSDNGILKYNGNHIDQDVMRVTTDLNGDVFVTQKNLYFYIDENESVFHRSDGTGNATLHLETDSTLIVRRFA